MKKKIGRNEPCPCGSGKKFKKCCENKMISKKFMATKIESPQSNNGKVTSFFQSKISQVIPTDAEPKTERKIHATKGPPQGAPTPTPPLPKENSSDENKSSD